ELAAGVLRRRAELDRLLPLPTMDPRLRDILRLGAYQLRHLTRVPAYAAVATSVELAREAGGERAAGYVNRLLRDMAREAGGGTDASRSPRPAQLPGFAQGAFIVQDPAAALVCRFVAAPPGALVYDGCASPGGKTVGLERLGARVLAGDRRHDRVARLAETAR